MHLKLSWLAVNPLNWTQFKLNSSHKYLRQLMCTFLTHPQSPTANNLSDISWKSKKSSEHIAAGTWEALYRFCIFSQNSAAPNHQSRMCCNVHFGQRQHFCPGESQNWVKKKVFSQKMVYYRQNFERGNSVGLKWQWGGGQAGGHNIVTCNITWSSRLHHGCALLFGSGTYHVTV